MANENENAGNLGSDGNAPITTPQGPTGGNPADIGAGPKAAEKTYSFKEDRSDWVPAHRMSEQSKRIQAAEARANDLQAKHDEAQRRVQALAGVTPKSQEDTNDEEIVSYLTKKFPGLAAIKDFSSEQLQDMLEATQSAKQTSAHHWERHANDMLTTLEKNVAEQLGLDELTPAQQRRVRSAYREDAEAAVQARQNGADPKGDFLDRHEKGDKKLLKEFADEFVKPWLDTAKRSVTAAAVRRQGRAVPNGGRSSLTVTKQPEIDYNNEDAFKNALIEARNSR